MPQLSNVSKKFGEQEANFFSGFNPFTLSKFKCKEIAEKLNFHKISELMHAWFTLNGKVKKIRCCPVNQLKLFAVFSMPQWSIVSEKNWKRKISKIF